MWNMTKVRKINRMFYLARAYSKTMFDWEPTYVVNTCNSTKICDSVSDILTCSAFNQMNKIDDMAWDWGLKSPCDGTLRTINQDCNKLQKSCP